MSGAFDPRPARDVLTSLLNGVGPYKLVELDEEERRIRKREKKERDRERRKAKAAAKARHTLAGDDRQASTSTNGTRKGPSSFWAAGAARPSIQIATNQRSASITPPPVLSPLLPYTPSSTPGPSISSSTSRTSSKRPHTPDDFEDVKPQIKLERKRKPPVKKGWKGWVEGSPPPSEKLINLDAVPVLQERRTRSGKNFDAIGPQGWI